MYLPIKPLIPFALHLSLAAASSSNDLPNANHIFNAVHSSMRQWGSSLYHNGMSFFVAKVPAHTQFYHGRSDNKTVTGMEWLAFEPEHALMFARPRRPGHPPGHGGPGGRHPPGGPPPMRPGQQPMVLDESHDQLPYHAQHDNRPPFHGFPFLMDNSDDEFDLRNSRDGDDDKIEPGWLNTYVTKRDLQFLYIDGTSAGKSDKGTQDSTDRLLLGRTADVEPPLSDYDRAKELCAKVENEWGSKVAGIIRMECGFEIIMCDFEASVDLVYRVASDGEPIGDHFRATSFALDRSVASRYHGIGEGRVELDYETMVSAYTEIDVPLENEGHRLNETDREVLAKLRNHVADMITSGPVKKFSGVNWQSVADMIVTRYSDWLRYLISPTIVGDNETFHYELSSMLKPFVNHLSLNASAEIHRCSRHYLTSVLPDDSLPSSKNASLAQRAVTSISERICSTLVDAYHDKDAALTDRVGQVHELVQYLRWTSFKECKGCGYDEVCVVAAWPFGTRDEHYDPTCKNVTTAGVGPSYWHDDWNQPSIHGQVREYEEFARYGTSTAH